MCATSLLSGLEASEDEERASERRRPSLEASEDEPRCFRLGVTLWLTLGFHAALYPLPEPLPLPPTPPPFRLFPSLPSRASLLLLLLLHLLLLLPLLSFLLSIRFATQTQS